MAYDDTQKISLVQEYECGKPVDQLSEESGIPRNSIYRWIREYKTIKVTSGVFTPNDYLKLTKHSAKADHILEIIRLSCCISKVPLRKRLEILEMIHNSHTEYSVHELCEALEVDRGTFYNHIFRRLDTKWKDEQEHQYLRIVRQINDESN